MSVNQTLPWSWYSDPDILEREQAFIFRESWQYVGHTAMLASPGSFFPADISNVPVVITRDVDDGLHALRNVCAHRGSIVCELPGSRSTLQCPYHAWTYGLEGSLLAAPRSDREDGFDITEHSLRRLDVDRWGPFIFARAAVGGPSLVDALGDIPGRVAEIVDVDALEFHHRATGRYRANWKVCIENYLECYHCRVAHPSFASVIETGPDDYRLVTSVSGSSQYGPIRQTWAGGFDPVGPIARSQFHLFHPNTVVSIFPGQANLSIGPVIPAGAGTTRRALDYFFGADVEESWKEDLLKLDDQVGREDLVLVESAQRGMEAAQQDRGVLLLDSESLIAHFRDYVLAAADRVD